MAWIAAMLLALAIAAALAFVGWAVRSERGTLWLLSLVPSVEVDGPRGRLIGDFDAQQVRIRLPGGENQLVLNGLGWRGLALARGHAPLWLRLEIDELAIARVDLTLVPPETGPPPSAAPTDLRLPFELDVRALRLGIVYATQLGSEPLRDVRAHLHLGADHGAEHRIDDLSLAWDRLQARGSARIASAPPLPLRATLALTQPATPLLPAWNASATLTGPLAEPLLQATMRADAAPSLPPTGRDRRPPRAPQALDLRATLRPFAPWPLGELEMSAQALDLAAFSSAAPITALSGRAVALSTAVDQPASVSADLTNALPGRWNDGRLPVQRIALELAARPDEPNVLTLNRFDATLGNATARAGQVSGSARWAPKGWALDLTLTDVLPALLDARAPALRASGPLKLAGQRRTVQVQADLTGEVQGLKPAQPVRLKVDATLDPQRVELRDVQALAGGARASVGGVVAHTAADAPWTAKLDGALVDFDPALWWPGRDDATAAWQRRPSRLNATLKADVELPADATGKPVLAMLAALRGDAAVTLAPSTLAGVPLAGSAQLRSAGGAPVESTLELRADGGNRVRATGKVATGGDGGSDVWDVTLTGPALARLAPVYALFGGGGTPKEPPLAGALNATARVVGRWPALSTKGQFDANALRIGTLGVQQAQGRWSLGTSLAAPVEAQVTLTQAALRQAGGAPGPSIESATLQLQGTGRAHTLELRADSKARPPAWVDVVQGVTATPPSAHTLVTLRVQGGLVDQPGAPIGGWRGTLQQLDLRDSSRAAEAAPLARVRDVAIDAAWAGGPARVTLAPGRADVLGGAVRWSRAAWSAPARDGEFALLDVQAEVDPIRIAPLLQRVQPEFGWGGDLTLRAHLDVRSAPTFHADVVIERAGGDLTVTEEATGMRALGMTDLRLGLAADNGVWNFTQGLAGSTVGVGAGAVVVRTSPQATWPPADAPISGVFELRVADLGTWGTWVPPGWRLGGALRASAGIDGRFGAPEYTGEVSGSQLAVRNFLQGVNVREGEVAIRLRGTTAQIERFTAKAGDGSVTLTGNASLGEAPKALLELTAERFQVLGRLDRRIVASGQGRLQIDAKSLGFNGDFKVDEGLIDFTHSDAPALSDDVEVVRRIPLPAARGAGGAGADSTDTAPTNREVALDVRVGLGEKLRLRGRGLDTGLAGELRITSPGGRLAVNGTVRAVDGTYAAYGQKLVIDRGVIAFNGAVENPRLDIEATRPNLDVRVGVAVSGSATAPRVRLFSEPELSEIDKLSWLVMGRASDGLGRTDTALLQRAALALLAGEGGGPTDQLTKAIGLDEIGVRQTETGDVRETVVSLGKQLSRRWYVGYERGLNATTGNFQLIYRIAQRFTLRAQSGADNSLDVIWTWRWK